MRRIRREAGGKECLGGARCLQEDVESSVGDEGGRACDAGGSATKLWIGRMRLARWL